MLIKDDYVYRISELHYEPDRRCMCMYVMKYSNEYNASNNIDPLESFYYAYKGDDYWLDPDATFDEALDAAYEKLGLVYDDNGGFDDTYIGRKYYWFYLRLAELRQKVADMIDNNTKHIIRTGFKFSLQPDAVFDAELEWQFDVQNLVLNKEALTYPYKLKINVNKDGKSVYLTLNSADELQQLYIEMFAFVDATLRSGREEKAKLPDMNYWELITYKDPRV